MDNQASDPGSKWSLKTLLESLQNPLYKNSLLLITDSAITSGLGFFFWMIVARFYNASDLGFGSAAISAMTLLSTLSLIGVNFTMIRFLPKSEKPIEMINSYLTLSSIIAICVSAIFLIGIDTWSPALIFIKHNLFFGAAFIAFTLFFAISTITRNIFIAKRRVGLALSIDTIQSSVKIPLAAVLVIFFHSFGIAAAWGITIMIGVLLTLFVFLPGCQSGYKPLPVFNFEIIGKLWHYSAGNYITSLLSMTPNWILPLMVLNISGSEQNAYFFITWTIGNLLNTIPVAASNSLFVEGSHLSHSLGLNIRKTLKFNYLLLVPIIWIVLFLGNYILGLFGAEYAVHGSVLLKILAISSLFVSLNFIYYTILRIENRIKELCTINAIQAILMLMGSYLILPVMGTQGVGYIWLGIQILISLYVLLKIQKYLWKIT